MNKIKLTQKEIKKYKSYWNKNLQKTCSLKKYLESIEYETNKSNKQIENKQLKKPDFWRDFDERQEELDREFVKFYMGEK